MTAVLMERFKHGSIGLFCADNDNYYVSVCYYRKVKHKTILKHDILKYCGFNSYVKAYSAYSHKRDYMGAPTETIK